MPSLRHVEVSEFAPKVWGAACELLGGEGRIEQPYTWGNGFIANLGLGADRPWEPPSASSPGWHKDGDFFRHFLDSPEQGLLTIVLWSDIEERGGGTFIAPDSVAPVARLLEQRREGVLPDDFPYDELIAQCSSFVETTGRLGDVVLMHPYMLHAVSQNHRGTARFITNPPIALSHPMRFDRDDPAEHSPVERAVLRALGVERLDYRPAAPREDVVPERVRRQERMREQEEARLAEAAS
jgi:ectoine hydroxylase-related dioxygenase (phytanoyl-CoA dioxygenase family)